MASFRDLEKYPDEFYFERFGETKICKKCEIEHPTTNFQIYQSKGKQGKILQTNICRDCTNKRKRGGDPYGLVEHTKYNSDLLLECCGYDVSRKDLSIHEQFKIRIFENYGVILE